MKKTIIIIACLFTTVCNLDIVLADQSQCLSLYDEALRNFREGRMDLAIAMADKSLRQAASSERDGLCVLKSSKLLGDLYVASGMTPEAITAYTKAFEVHQKIFAELHPNTTKIVKMFTSKGVTPTNVLVARELLTRILELNELAGHSEDPCTSVCLAECLIAMAGEGNPIQCLDARLAEKR